MFPIDPFLSFSFSYSYHRALVFQLSWQYFSLLLGFLLIFLKYLHHCSNHNLDCKIQSYLTIQGTIVFSFIGFHVFSVSAFGEPMVVLIKAAAKNLG